jgi:hypothetical protein
VNDSKDARLNTTPGSAQAEAQAPAALTAEEQQRLRTLVSQLKEYQRLQEATLEQKETERLRALAEKGQIEEALNQQRAAWEQKHAEALSRYSSLERQVYEERKTAAIAEAFHGRSFVGDSPEQKTAAAAMVRRLLQDEFETVRDGSGALLVRDKASGRPAAEAIRERLDSPQFAIFFAPSSRGGAGGDGTRPTALPHAGPPGSLESIASQYKDRCNQYQSFGLHPVR